MKNHAELIDVQSLSTEQLVVLFSTLQAPTIEEMHGEYAASMLSQPNPLATLAGLSLSNPLLPWQSKAFRPVDQHTGRGYNTFLLGSKTIQLYPMHTLIAPSRYDGQPAYQLVYRYFHSLCGAINMVDEIRKLDEGRYLGIGTWGFNKKQRQIPYPFLLQGPHHPYRSDIGRIRTGFQASPADIPALNQF
jgi:hypothetical protein